VRGTADRGTKEKPTVKRRLTHLVVTLLLVTFGAIGTASAGPATDVVKAKQTALFAAIKASDDKKVASLFDEMLDYGAFAESSLGTEWANRSAGEKNEFSDLLKKLVRKSYECNLKKILNFDIEYIGESENGAARLVKTKAKPKAGGESVEIVFKMVEGKGSWKVHDIETETVSLVSNNRSQFTKIIKKDGFGALIQKMKDKLAKSSCEG
jgi:phospholipid transport system substrate-binding protein